MTKISDSTSWRTTMPPRRSRTPRLYPSRYDYNSEPLEQVGARLTAHFANHQRCSHCDYRHPELGTTLYVLSSPVILISVPTHDTTIPERMVRIAFNDAPDCLQIEDCSTEPRGSPAVYNPLRYNTVTATPPSPFILHDRVTINPADYTTPILSWDIFSSAPSATPPPAPPEIATTDGELPPF
jgi:hypothetical protein